MVLLYCLYNPPLLLLHACVSCVSSFERKLEKERKPVVVSGNVSYPTPPPPPITTAEQCFLLTENLLQAIRSTTQILVVTHHQYGISSIVPQMSFLGETCGGVRKCWLFSDCIFGHSLGLSQTTSHNKNSVLF